MYLSNILSNEQLLDFMAKYNIVTFDRANALHTGKQELICGGLCPLYSDHISAVGRSLSLNLCHHSRSRRKSSRCRAVIVETQLISHITLAMAPSAKGRFAR